LFGRAHKISRYAKSHDTDVVISHMEEANFTVSLASKLFNLSGKIIATVHTNPLSRGHLYRFAMRILYPIFDVIVACSQGVGKILEDDFGLNKTQVIYNPVDVEQAKLKAKEPMYGKYKKHFTPEPVFVNIGRLTEAKGQRHLIRAFRKVADENPEAKLIILGEGELRSQLENLIERLELQGKVILAGNQSNVFPFLRQADCFVSSSLWEGLQITLIEALAVGTPVISTDCKIGPREIIAPELSLDAKVKYPYSTDHGTLTMPLNLDEVAGEEMLTNEMLSYINKGSKSVVIDLSRFNEDIVINQWENLMYKPNER
jgi:glycosyltransferase involved in cell wall biosynthesis